MGVKGLTTFVENYQRSLFSKERIKNCSLVIDGFGLLFYLYYMDSRFGGEYEDFARNARQFFSQLKSCDIKPFVIFDGPISESKLPCILGRQKEKVRSVARMVRSKRNEKVLPILAVEVFQQILLELGVPFLFTIDDADAEICSLANTLECPVLGEDSDFYIFNIDHGYLPLSRFGWEELYVDKFDKKSIRCQLFKVSIMSNLFGVDVPALPYLSILLGNDWIDRDTFSQLLANLPQVRSNSKQKRAKVSKAGGKIGTVLHWLSIAWKNDNLMMEKLEASLPKSKRSKIMAMVEECVTMYKDLPDTSITSETMSEMSCKKDFLHSPTPQMESDLTSLVRHGFLPPFAMDIIKLHTVYLRVPSCDPSRPSSNSCSEDIRAVLYGIIAKKFAPPPKTLYGNIFTLQEFDRVGLDYKSIKWTVVQLSSCPVCEDSNCKDVDCCNFTLNNDELASNQVDFVHSQLKIRIFSLLQINAFYLEQFEHFEKSIFASSTPQVYHFFEYVLVSTVYWHRRTSPESAITCSMLLSILWSIYHNSPIEGTNPHIEGSKCPLVFPDFLDVLCPLPRDASGKFLQPTLDLDLELLHSASEWQSLLLSVCQLRQVLMRRREKSTYVESCMSSNIALRRIYHRVQMIAKNNKTVELGPLLNLILGQFHSHESMEVSFKIMISALHQ